MEENNEMKKMTPLEFVNYLEGYFMIIGRRGLFEFEAINIKRMLENVEKNLINTPLSDFNFIPTRTSPSVPDPNFYQQRDTSIPDPNFVSTPTENICYHYNSEKGIIK